MGSRRPNPRIAKSLRTYDVAEIATLYSCHRNTVRNWLKLGLTAIDDGRPTLVRGDVLNAFHAERRRAAKRPCGPGEIYCVPCRMPQRPAGGIVDCRPIRQKVWAVTGICPRCGRLLRQRAGRDRLEGFRSMIDVGETKA